MSLLYFIAQAKQLDVSIYDMFERAYEWQHSTTGLVVNDYCQFIQHGIMPNYLLAFLKSLQEKENEDSTAHTRITHWLGRH